MWAMKLRDVVIETMSMEKRRVPVRIDRNVPLAFKLSAHCALNPHQPFWRRQFVKPDADFAGVGVDPELFDLRLLFEKPRHSRINKT
jgi:hypothetical protein